MIKRIFLRILSQRTLVMLGLDFKRFRARHWGNRNAFEYYSRLHLGCGNRKVSGWLNCDLENSDYDIDLASGVIPFKSNQFEAIVCQHVIEHLELRNELTPLLRECYRVLSDGGSIWLSCPDMERVCNDYVNDRGQALIIDKQTRVPGYSVGTIPSQHAINELFHQDGEHKNLFDFELLQWVLLKAGFREITRISEANLLEKFNEFPDRKDDYQSLYVTAIKPK